MNSEQAYAETDRITRETAKNFAWGIRVLPGPKRRAIAALYAFARRVDDLADQDTPARAELESWRAAVEALPASRDGDAILVALADVMPIRAPRCWRCATCASRFCRDAPKPRSSAR